MWRISGQGCGMDRILFISREGLNNGVTTASVGLRPDLLWDSGKPQSQTPEETAQEGGDETAQGHEASCFLQGRITSIRERLVSPHLPLVCTSLSSTDSASAPPPSRVCCLDDGHVPGWSQQNTGASNHTIGRMFAVVCVQGRLTCVG